MNDDLPFIELSSQDNYLVQLNNAKTYQKRSLLGKIGFCFVPITVIPLLFLKWIYKYDGFKESPYLFSVGFFIAIFAGVLGTFIFARCPHCKSLQPGKSTGIFPWGITRRSGFSPWANRCVKCNYYLSVKELNKDKQVI